MKNFLLLLILIIPAIAFSQSVLPLRADTVRIEKIGGSAELHLRNSTRDTLGVLTNIGNGRTRFMRARMSGDTLFVGKDTLLITTDPTLQEVINNGNHITDANDSIIVNDGKVFTIHGGNSTAGATVHIKAASSTHNVAASFVPTGINLLHRNLGSGLYKGIQWSSAASSSISVLDQIEQIGLSYAANYRTNGIATFGDRWIPDWGAVKDSIAANNFTLYNALGGTGDTLVNADKEIKWLEAGFGITRSATGTTVTHKADTTRSTGLPTYHYVDSSIAANPALTATYVGFGDTSNKVSGESDYTYNSTTNTIRTDSANLKRTLFRGDSTFSAKIVFAPIKTKTGSVTAAIGYGESNNEHDGDSTVNNTFEAKIGKLDGTGPYIRWGMEKRWLPYPFAPAYQFEAHPIEVRTTADLVIRPISWTMPEQGSDAAIMLLKSGTFQFDSWDGQKNIALFNRTQNYIRSDNSGGVGVIEFTVRDTGVANRKIGGFQITSQVAGLGPTDQTVYEFFGEQNDLLTNAGLTFYSAKAGDLQYGRNFVFSIKDTNAGRPMWVGRGWGESFSQAFEVDASLNTVFGPVNVTGDGSKVMMLGSASNAAQITSYNNSINTVDYPLTIDHITTGGNAANGFGAGFKIKGINGSSIKRDLVTMEGVYTDVTNTTEKSDLIIKTLRNGTSTEALRITDAGDAHVKGQLYIDSLSAGASTDSILTWNPATGQVRKVHKSVIGDGNGTYTPTLTNTTNVAASTAYPFQWSRSGNTITFSGEVDIDPTSATTLTVLTMTLPAVGSFGNTYECAGTASDELGTSARVRATVSAGTAEIRFTPTDVTNRRFSVHGQYTYIAP